MPNAAEIAQVSGNSFAHQLLMGVLADLPVIRTFDARLLVGDKVLSLAITALPTGRFINLGEGYTAMQTDTALGEYNAARIGGSLKVQESTMKKWNERNRESIGANLAMDYWGIQAMGGIKGQLRAVQRQIFQGVSADAKGFPGLKALTPYASGNTLTVTGVPQDGSWQKSVLDVAGTTSTTASSIYSVAFGELDCQLCIGGPNGLEDFLTFPTPERVWLEATDAIDSATKGDWYHVASNEGYVGLSVMGSNEANASRKFPQYSVRRAANVTADTGKTASDNILQRLWDMHPDGHKPNAFYMSHRSVTQIQTARTAAQTVFLMGNAGANAKDATFTPLAPIPTEWNGIPIIGTDAIGNTDAIES